MLDVLAGNQALRRQIERWQGCCVLTMVVSVLTDGGLCQCKSRIGKCLVMLSEPWGLINKGFPYIFELMHDHRREDASA